ncbi:16S rRNA (uracil(1498)-N(3))-methyltransferase [Chelatococcus sambhunathii]|uniref:Ribosomal RNA small subunit methyltransferase E n=1 Tax=Chelatococcus sambhunathii TaxID=363953 RepID=A0ABU1DL81_9HYPH|nr:16S rRNA (uracil(1498)-N(3))-methyltransferase [Chelatococcus sambhunathii]MDR4308734.1 16S rRNA (uracil(1498)-N(3))-methyltransferase [Chelatococcus sambhunathii]
MPDYDFSSTRLFVDAALAEGAEVTLEDNAANYVRNVLRMSTGDGLLLFNGREGEWGARVAEVAKKRVLLTAEQRTREQTPAPSLRLMFAPLKHARLDYMVQKAVEMGVSRLSPTITRRTQVARVNLDRMRANAIEAAEQCGVLTIPSIDEPASLEASLEALHEEAALIFCDEAADAADGAAALAPLRGRPLALLIGPEGGFDPQERATLLRRPGIVRFGLGPRILRADTAAVAALALVQVAAGDWR